MSETNRRTVTILSIDGGGIRGIIPARVLARIEKETGRPIAELFDLIAGTSTGGLLALGLTRPDPGDRERPRYRAAELAAFYEEEGPRIFDRSPWQRVRSVEGLIDEKYSAEVLEEVLEKYFQEVRLKEALTEVLVTAYALERRQAYFFKRYKARKDPARDFPMREVARATSAAPTYFEPARLKSPHVEAPYTFVDGGVFANNPAMCAYAEAKVLFPEADQFLVVSLGTGELTRPIRYEEAADWGAIEWAQPVLDVVFHGVSDTVDYQIGQVLADQVHRYWRFQVTLKIGKDDFDDASKTNLHVLRRLADRLLRRRADDIEALCERLQEPQAPATPQPET